MTEASHRCNQSKREWLGLQLSTHSIQRFYVADWQQFKEKVETLDRVVIASEVQIQTSVVNYVSPIALVSAAITVTQKESVPTVEDKIFLSVATERIALIHHYLPCLRGPKEDFRSMHTVIQSFILVSAHAPAASFEMTMTLSLPDP